jgi:hypothetical protein
VKKAARAGHPVTPDETSADEAERIGAALLALVIEARAVGVDAETALRDVVRRARVTVEVRLTNHETE